MSAISTLAKGFERSAIERSRATDEAVTSALQQHESALLQALNSSEQRTGAAILASQKRVARVALTSWLTLVGILVATLGLSVAMLWWQRQEIVDVQREVQRQRSTLQQLTDEGGATRVSTCGERAGTPRLCVEVDTDEPAWGKNSEFRILEGY